MLVKVAPGQFLVVPGDYLVVDRREAPAVSNHPRLKMYASDHRFTFHMDLLLNYTFDINLTIFSIGDCLQKM